MASYISNWDGDFATAALNVNNGSDTFAIGMYDAFMALYDNIDSIYYGYDVDSSTHAHGWLFDGSFDIYGSKLNTYNPTITKLIIRTDGWTYQFNGKVNASEGSLTHLLITNNLSTIECSLKATYGKSTMTTSWLKYTAADGSSLVLTGPFKFNSNTLSLSGDLTALRLEDDDGNWFLASGMKGISINDVNDHELYPTYYDFVKHAMSGNDAISGTSSDDVLRGFAGDDTLTGGAGEDKLIGGADNDTYFVDNLGDHITELLDEGTDNAKVSISVTGSTYTLEDNVENAALINTLGNHLTGNDLANVLTGNKASNTLTGNGGNDILDGGESADILIGGDGNDIYFIDNVGDVITETGTIDSDADTVKSALTVDLTLLRFDGIENATLLGSANINTTGDELNNILIGNDGKNILNGGVGADSLAGGKGDDTYVVNSSDDSVSENLKAGTDLIKSSISYELGANVENLTLTGVDNLNGAGNALANTITGNDGHNQLDGGTGIDTLIGGKGDDSYLVDNAKDVITEKAGEGTDYVQTTLTAYTLGKNIEELEYDGDGNFKGTGNELSNIIESNEGNDTLYGMAGDDFFISDLGTDKIYGGTGNDTVEIDGVYETVEDLLASGNFIFQRTATNVVTVTGSGIFAAVNYTLTDVEAIRFVNSSYEEVNANLIQEVLLNQASAFDDCFDSDAPMTGGMGNDTYVVDDENDSITEAPKAGADVVRSFVNYTLDDNVESLTLVDSDDISGTGNALANTITGNAGDNVLNGGLGADKMYGGAGNDAYHVDNVSDVIVENAGEGDADRILTTLTTYKLGKNIEELEYYDPNGNFKGTGNELNNVIESSEGDDTLYGMAGDDFFISDLGTDKIYGGTGIDTVDIGGEYDTVEDLLASGYYTFTRTAENVITVTGTDIFSAVNYTLTDVEAIRFVSTSYVDIDANLIQEVLLNQTSAFADYFDDDTIMAGGKGNDTYVVDNLGDIITESLKQGTDTVLTNVDGYWLDDNVENLTIVAGGIDGPDDGDMITVYGNALNNIITGNDTDDDINSGAGNDTLIGGAGNDYLDSGSGADTMKGGAGNDGYFVENAGDKVTEFAGEGAQDSVTAFLASYTLTANVENLRYDDYDDDASNDIKFTGKGNELNNSIRGGGNNDTLDGKAGNDLLFGSGGIDTIDGGIGNDTVELVGFLSDYTIMRSSAGFIITGNAGSDVEGDVVKVTNIECLYFQGDGSTIGPLQLDGIINVASAWNDYFDMDGTMAGGKGDDTYIVDNSILDIVVEGKNAGTDHVMIDIADAGGTYALGSNIEKATLINAVAYDLDGNTLNNVLTGNAADNFIDGSKGNDTMIGGDGNDSYYVDSTKDVVIEKLGEGGADCVNTTLASYTLGDNIDLLSFYGNGNFKGIGNSLNNYISGGEGKDSLYGMAGDDQLYGLMGNDYFDGGEGNDIVVLDGLVSDYIITRTGETTLRDCQHVS